MFSRGTLPAFVLSLALVALADPVPSTPSPGQVFNAGSSCDIAWTPDSTGQWKTMNIQLMTGDNFQMVPLTTVASVDGTTSPGTFTYTCPSVTLNAPVFFYQFSHPENASDLLWTGRFTIASASGATVPAPNATQPGGQAIPWGTAALTDPSKAVPPPSYLPGGSTTSGSNSTSSVPASGSASSVTPAVVVSSSGPTNAPLAALSPTVSSSSSSASASTPALSGSDANGALMLGALSARAAQAGIALAVIASTFTFMV